MRWLHSCHSFQPGCAPSHQPLHEELDISPWTRWHRPCIGPSRQFLECTRGRTRRIRFTNRTLLPNGASQVLVLWNLAGEFKHYIEEPCCDAFEAMEKLSSGAGNTHLVGQHAEAIHTVTATQHLDEGIRVS